MPDTSPRTSATLPENPAREVLRLAVPAFLALVAEPLFLLADSAIVGHLGVAQLAGLGVASAALLTAANVFVFLAYGTTSAVARRLGAGREDQALAVGIDGVWLSVVLGALTAVVVAVGATDICRALGASADALPHAVSYLRFSAIGLPAMLVVLAATGILRGMLDTRTPLVVSVAGFTLNVALNYVLVYGVHLGVAGSALGTVIAQWLMAVALLVVVVGEARRKNASLHPHPTRVLAAGREGVPLLVRTLALRAVLLLTTWTAAGFGDATLAAYQVTSTVWTFLAFSLDALAIAAQALTGRSLGAGDRAATRATTSLMVRWGAVYGFVVGVLVLAVHTVLPTLFTGDEATRAAISGALVVVAIIQPVAGIVFVLDGVLIGAGDGPWLARAQLAVLVGYLPVIALVRWLGPPSWVGASPVEAAVHGAVWLWIAFSTFMIGRGALLWLRSHTSRWMVTGAGVDPVSG
ncbi:MATE family efflux transporter [Arsenicicoccus piscis]|uniref:MATE family efflux transporter n=1 Tax=Arsenicicoccus piscis TaxID=673954 RepID=A0ABQ6HT16_9MICO|nr:MATE family efflux transporter [Arsenicicoccus piscis]MCH8627476.1 MATE family efflux transporter [Arsenicicoccus piscis]GMA21643.1 MATE family efflux transporter [Arsenicicoccus piscis]